jgi:DNA-directed RNA polymerase subunit beta
VPPPESVFHTGKGGVITEGFSAMPTAIQQNFSLRKNFAKIKSLVPIPNLIDIQRKSYEKFLQFTVDPEKREQMGLQAVFNSVFPIKDYNETASLEFVSYHLEKPKYDVDECRSRGMTFAAPMKVIIRLVIWDKDEVSGTQSIRDVKEQDVYSARSRS